MRRIIGGLSFVVIAIVGGVSMLCLVSQAGQDGTPAAIRWTQLEAALVCRFMVTDRGED